ncbi:PRC-barrel domain-containing protein [Alteromonas sp. ASW11-130]|uniref:PRC-barrel domain-containing protein n=1 Tax=Alteromonas sp. ASW11-130 TaxID=3015775 RepID=UPI0022429AC9|nr:PRC-barrel domain-containing protein [Alteromonas sp. ASW11-130]MCW8092330.1 PRC-barrel domain-containing protein [Alteromonas sp. ASW11-130]
MNTTNRSTIHLPTNTKTNVAYAIALALGIALPIGATAQDNIEPENAQVEVIKGKTDVKVKQPAPEVDVAQKEPEVDVEVGEATVDVAYQEPEIDIEQQEPEVNVVQAEPEIVVKSAEPEVTFNKAEPEIHIEKSEPEIAVVRKDEEGELREDSDIASINHLTIEELEGRDVVNANGEEVGSIAQVVKSNNGDVSLVIESGGVLGLGSEKSVLSVNEVELQSEEIVWNTNNSAENLPQYNESNFVELTRKEQRVEDLISMNR